MLAQLTELAVGICCPDREFDRDRPPLVRSFSQSSESAALLGVAPAEADLAAEDGVATAAAGLSRLLLTAALLSFDCRTRGFFALTGVVRSIKSAPSSDPGVSSPLVPLLDIAFE